MKKRRVPTLILLTVSFVAGIALGQAAGSLLPFLGAAALGAIGALALRGRREAMAAAMLCACALGGLRSYAAWHPALPAEGDYTITATVAQAFTTGSRGQQRTVLRDVSLDGKTVAGMAYWSFYGEVLADAEPGARVCFTGSVYAPPMAENPGGFDFRAYLLQRGMTFGVYGADGVQVEMGQMDLLTLAARARAALTAKLCAVMGQESGAYAAAMLLGDKSLVPEDELDAFSRLGVAHILAVSGFHVGLLAGVLAFVLRRLRVGQGASFLLLCILLGSYCVLTGLSASAVRAATILLLARLGRLCWRRSDLPVLLCAAAALILLVQPAQLTAAGFQMTFLAMLGIAYVTPSLARLLSPKTRAGRWAWQSVAATLGAQLGLIGPLTWWYQRLPLLGVVVNLLLLPYAALLMAAYLALCAGMRIPGVGPIMGAASSALTQGLVAAAEWLSRFPLVSLWTTRGSALTWVLSGVLGAALCLRVRWRARTRALVGSAAAVGLALTLVAWPLKGTEYLQLSVGSADAAVLRDGGYTCVIDTGEDGTLATYLRQNRLSVELLVVTHLHRDHAAGIAYLLKEDIPVARCVLPEGAEECAVDSNMAALIQALAARGTEIIHAGRGDVFTLPSGEMTVLWPVAGKTRAGADANAYSLTVRAVLRGTSLLLPGDLDGLYERYAAAPSDILKVAHHGSAAGTSEAFLRQVAPQTVLLSGGDEKRLAGVRDKLPDTPLFATQQGGAVLVRIGAGGYSVSSFR